ncbi:MAG: hypothetical protein QG608_2210 [Actinomycetota bacterium]|nr:hypothetical protein [Actinomycetota bacterium]
MRSRSCEDFTEFAIAAWPRLVRTAHLLTGDFHEAEDLVQTTLGKVYGRWRRIPPGAQDAYVRRALVNNNISRIRKRRVVHLFTPFLPERPARADSDMVDDRAAVFQALAGLPPRQRAALILRFWEDLSTEEIGQCLGCSPNTVKTHLRRGLAVLRNAPDLTSYAAVLGGNR